jgi:hypothetical protein
MDQKLGGTPNEGVQQLEEEEPVVESQAVVEEVQVQAEPVVVAAAPQPQAEAQKGLFGKFKRK